MAVAVLLLSTTTAGVSRLNIVGHASTSAPPVASEICLKKACHPELCANLGNLDNQYDLEKAALQWAMDLAGRGIQSADASLSSNPDDKHKENLEVCRGFFEQAVGNMTKAAEVLKANGTETELNWRLSMALIWIDACSSRWHDAGFTEDFQLGPISEHVIKLLRNALALGNNMSADDKDSS